MRLRLDPPIDEWPVPTPQRPIWTGHQAFLWHPGILTKYLAAEAVSRRAGSPGSPGVAFGNVVVDQDVYDPLSVTLPRRDSAQPDRLMAQRFSLGPVVQDVPPHMQPAVKVKVINERITGLPADVVIDRDRLIGAFRHTDRESPFLAYQMDTVLRRLAPAYAASASSRFASGLLRGEAEVMDRLLHDATQCARIYNKAVRAVPEAGMRPMSVERDRVEVPLWKLGWMRPRERVFVDLADSTPIFVTEDGEPVAIDEKNAPGRVVLAPRALLMTAMLRRPDRCGLFVHGTGGGNYDRVTERWWAAWAGEVLAPMAVVTADLHLTFGDLPVNGPEELARAKWYAHHLPHNVDRVLGLPADDPDVRAKRELLEHMDDDRDAGRRRSAFTALHRINKGLVKRHADALAEAGRAVDRADAGVANAATAGRRDWPLACYPAEALAALVSRLEASG
ncbi:MAG: hypothetical protein AAF800_08230 [Planctomycetota bacterium]